MLRFNLSQFVRQSHVFYRVSLDLSKVWSLSQPQVERCLDPRRVSKTAEIQTYTYDTFQNSHSAVLQNQLPSPKALVECKHEMQRVSNHNCHVPEIQAFDHMFFSVGAYLNTRFDFSKKTWILLNINLVEVSKWSTITINLYSINY